ncbi:hypothetical protein [Zooshikella harenae]|uniref:Uncharacterized protein n=1 Tax=Zooshikella harenae TaxID=2827238 RepID=A0ABS5ZJH2_9GAMM|nr:hypothetical protein [Zooshikella harenae]MBU2714236.1 hypothetical protein [Zooshikella harenae]
MAKKKKKEETITAVNFMQLISEALSNQPEMELKHFLKDGSVERFVVFKVDNEYKSTAV